MTFGAWWHVRECCICIHLCSAECRVCHVSLLYCLALKLKGSEVVLERLRQWAATRPNVTKMNLIG